MNYKQELNADHLVVTFTVRLRTVAELILDKSFVRLMAQTGVLYFTSQKKQQLQLTS